MTKEEQLKQEADELYKDWYAHKLGAISITDVICKMAEPREKRIEELEQENAILKGRTEGFEKQILGLLYKYESVYKRFPDLKDAMNEAERVLKENAELKSEKGCETCTKFDEAQLTKAKEIIKELLDTQSRLDPYRDIFKDRILKAEQFISEVEK